MQSKKKKSLLWSGNIFRRGVRIQTKKQIKPLVEGNILNVWFQKIGISTLWMITGKSKGVGWGDSKAKLLKEWMGEASN